jgi:hypothetical protein
MILLSFTRSLLVKILVLNKETRFVGKLVPSLWRLADGEPE